MLSAVFMGTPEIAVPALRLLTERVRVSLVVTQPDRPAGRGHQLQAPPVKQAALEFRANGCCFNVTMENPKDIKINGTEMPAATPEKGAK